MTKIENNGFLACVSIIQQPDLNRQAKKFSSFVWGPIVYVFLYFLAGVTIGSLSQDQPSVPLAIYAISFTFRPNGTIINLVGTKIYCHKRGKNLLKCTFLGKNDFIGTVAVHSWVIANNFVIDGCCKCLEILCQIA